MRHSIVLLSGGVDSTVCAALALTRCTRVSALTVDYGQPYDEMRAARTIALRLNIEHFTVRTDLPRAAGQLAGVPTTYVPARNTVLIALGLGLADVIDADDVYLGCNADDADYPDCTAAFAAAATTIAAVATSRPRRILAPLLDLDKRGVLALGAQLGAPLDLTWSCLSPVNHEQCGACRSCRELAEASRG